MGFDASMRNGLQALDNWATYFGNSNSGLLGVINAISTIGAVSSNPPCWEEITNLEYLQTISCLFVPSLSEAFGRKPALLLGIIIMIIAFIMQASSQNLATFIVARFLTGLGMSSAFIPSPVLITETAYPTHQGNMANLTFTIFCLGSISASWSTYATSRAIAEFTWLWRIPSILQGFFPLIQLCGLYFVPGSPRWLLAKGRSEEARTFLVKHHANGDEDSLLVNYEMRTMEDHIQHQRNHDSLNLSSVRHHDGIPSVSSNINKSSSGKRRPTDEFCLSFPSLDCSLIRPAMLSSHIICPWS